MTITTAKGAHGWHIQFNDVGVEVRVQVIEYDGTIVDLANVNPGEQGEKFVLLKKPSGLVVKGIGLFTELQGVDGVIRYITAKGDLNEVGQYGIQALIEFLGATRYHTEVGRFTVHPNLDATI